MGVEMTVGGEQQHREDLGQALDGEIDQLQRVHEAATMTRIRREEQHVVHHEKVRGNSGISRGIRMFFFQLDFAKKIQ